MLRPLVLAAQLICSISAFGFEGFPAPPPAAPEAYTFSVRTHDSSNYHPQGLCYDATADELVISYQSSNKLFRVDPETGNNRGEILHGSSHATSVTSYSAGWIVSSYTSNTGGQDMIMVSRGGNSVSNYGAHGQAYGGYPMTTMGDATLVRGNPSSSYTWSTTKSLRFSPISTPDSVFATYSTDIDKGIGDLCYDGSNIYALEYESELSGRRLEEGRRLGEQATVHKLSSIDYRSEKTIVPEKCPTSQVPAGIACKAGVLWVLCWGSSASSVIRMGI